MAILPSLLKPTHPWLDLMEAWNRIKGPTTCCGAYHYGPVIKNKVWEGIAKPDERLCLECITTRLGREIRYTEYSLVPWNEYRKSYFRGDRKYGT